MTEAEIYQKQVETCKQVQNMINELYISKDKLREKIKELEKYEKIYKEYDDNIIYWEIMAKIQLLKEILEED